MASRTGETASDNGTQTLLAASKVIVAAVAHSLASVGDQISVPGLRVLVMVHAAGSLNLSTVAESLGVNASSASRTCDRLVVAGLLDRRDAKHDRRQLSLTLTRRGAKFVDDVMAERLEILTRVVDAMPAHERKNLIRSLGAFVAAAESPSHQRSLDDHTGRLVRWIV